MNNKVYEAKKSGFQKKKAEEILENSFFINNDGTRKRSRPLCKLKTCYRATVKLHIELR